MPRINLTLSHEAHKILRETAEKTHRTASKVVEWMLESANMPTSAPNRTMPDTEFPDSKGSDSHVLQDRA